MLNLAKNSYVEKSICQLDKYLFFLMVTLSFSFFNLGYAANLDEASLTMVEKSGLGKNLAPLSLRLASTSAIYQVVVSEIGKEKTLILLKEEINRLLPEYQPKWNRYLADSYSKYFTVDEMLSLTEAGQNSRFFSKVKAKQPEVSQSMQKSSQKILNEITSKALYITLENVKRKNMAP